MQKTGVEELFLLSEVLLLSPQVDLNLLSVTLH